MGLEKSTVKSIMTALQKHYPGFYFKVHGNQFQVSGIPDIIGVHKGRFIGIEVKYPGREQNLSRKQELMIKRINMAGGIAFMSSSSDHTIQTLKERLNDG